jgi:hypothetical protein
LFYPTVSKRRNSSRIIINLVARTVVIAPDMALVLLTVPYFIAVIATIVYTNKLIKTGKITAAAKHQVQIANTPTTTTINTIS